MSEDFEAQLRESLRSIAPDEHFVPRLLAALEAERESKTRFSRRNRPRGAASRWWWSAALAASLVITVATERHLRLQREAVAGLEARRQVIQALYLTNQKLNLAYRVVRDETGEREEPGV